MLVCISSPFDVEMAMASTSRSVKAKITRLTREIGEIDDFFYKVKEPDLYASMLERKRDDRVRSTVLQIHTAIEDLLNSFIICRVLNAKPDERSRKMRSNSAQALREMLIGRESIGFSRKLNFAVALRLLNKNTKSKLMTLNALRNKCSHNWLLKTPVRHGKGPADKKPPLLMYQRRDLHQVEVLKEFASEYGPIYYKLFVKYLG
jgi:hypothetical protein